MTRDTDAAMRCPNTHMPLPLYAELHCLTNFTFLRGASHAEELVERAAELGYAALAITDECSLAGVVRAHLAAREAGLKLIVGTELRLADGLRLVLLATHRDGYGNLSELITRGRMGATKGRYRLGRSDLADGVPGCLAIWLPGDAVADGRWVAETFAGRAWLGVELHRGRDDNERLARLRRLGVETGLPPVACGDVHMHVRARRPLQDLLTAIRLNTPVAECGHALFPNGERHLRTRRRLAHLYPPDLMAESVHIAERCRFSLEELRYEYPDELVPAGTTPADHLRRLTEEGALRRWPAGMPEKVRALVEHELSLIAELRYEPYFLTVHDIVAFARGRGILCQGRGSAANSAVCYCLGITEVDPARMEMLFERFISKERNEPPDIDVDFEHERREEVIQYLYGKYGRERAALAAAVITYRPKSAIRDAGKALGFSPEQVDRLARNHAWWDGREVAAERLTEIGFDPENPRIRMLTGAVDALIGFPRHLSQHVGGFVISRGPLSRLVPIENAAMPERSIIQWDKDDLDALGLLKVDVLALGMLTAIRKALALISKHRNRPIALADIPPEDPAVYAMISRADTIGVFQIESRAQMSMLPRLKPNTFYDLVIEVAIIRPGPIQGNMVHPFLRRRQGLEPIVYPSPEVESVLKRTLGVPIFQEQVIKLAMVAAGFSAGEADGLRRALAAWKRKGKLQQYQEKLIAGMLERGYPREFAERVYAQIEGFGEYGFPESHAASFALLAYASAWLKCHEPAAFTCALLNSWPMGFYAPAQLVQDVRRHGVEVRAVDVTASDWDCTLEPVEDDLAIRLGLRLVKGLSRVGAERIVAARGETQFTNIPDLTHRAGLDRRDREALAAAGALATLAGDRHQARWQILGAESPPPLFRGGAESGSPGPGPRKPAPLPAPTEGEDLLADYASVGFTLGRHPLALLRPQLNRLRIVTAAHIAALPHGRFIRTAGLVTIRQRPASAAGVIFVTIEDETGLVNLVVWPKLIERQRRELLGARLLGVSGQIQKQDGVLHVVARRLYDHSDLLGALDAPSRNFR